MTLSRFLKPFRNRVLTAAMAALLSAPLAFSPVTTLAQTESSPTAPDPASDTYTNNEIIDAGHKFFGGVSRDMALAIERLFSDYGQPNGYILGEEGGGAFIAGARYGEGDLYTRNAGTHKIYWQGPSIGFDFGADGGRVMILVYNLHNVEDMYRTYVGVNGAAYLIGGVGVTVMSNHNVFAAPIRAGVGARLGISAGYLKFRKRPTWNPF